MVGKVRLVIAAIVAVAVGAGGVPIAAQQAGGLLQGTRALSSSIQGYGGQLDQLGDGEHPDPPARRAARACARLGHDRPVRCVRVRRPRAWQLRRGDDEPGQRHRRSPPRRSSTSTPASVSRLSSSFRSDAASRGRVRDIPAVGPRDHVRGRRRRRAGDDRRRRARNRPGASGTAIRGRREPDGTATTHAAKWRPSRRPCAGARLHSDTDVHLLDRIAVLYRYRRIAIAVFVLTTAAMMIQGYSSIQYFRAQGRLLIENERTTAIPGIGRPRGVLRGSGAVLPDAVQDPQGPRPHEARGQQAGPRPGAGVQRHADAAGDAAVACCTISGSASSRCCGARRRAAPRRRRPARRPTNRRWSARSSGA